MASCAQRAYSTKTRIKTTPNQRVPCRVQPNSESIFHENKD